MQRVMGKKSPCADCPKKGCGSYHDICEKFKTWKAGERENKEHIEPIRGSKPHMERSKSFRASKNCNVLKAHRR